MKNAVNGLFWLALAAGGLGIALCLTGALVTRLSPLEFRLALTLFRYGVFVLLGTGAVSLLLLPFARSPVLGVLVVVAGFAAFRAGQLKKTAQTVPAIHDISTDPENPPGFQAVVPLREGTAANDLTYDPAEYPLQLAAYPEVRPLNLPVPFGEAFALALKAARDLGWKIVHHSEADGLIEATDTTAFFGFKDDVAVRVTAADRESRIDVRSVSRVGKSDVGANAARITGFLARLRTAAGEK